MLLVGAALLGAQLPAAGAAGSRLPLDARGHGEGRTAVFVRRLHQDCRLLRSAADVGAGAAGRVGRRRQQLPAARSGVARTVLRPGPAAAAIGRRAAGAAPDGRRRLFPRARRAAGQGTLLRRPPTTPTRRASSSSTTRWRGVSGPNEDPIGQTVISPMTVIGPMGRSLMKRPLFQVVGVVASVKNSTLVRDAGAGDLFQLPPVPVPRPEHRRAGAGRCRGAARRAADVGAAARSEPAAGARRARWIGSSARRPTGRAR